MGTNLLFDTDSMASTVREMSSTAGELTGSIGTIAADAAEVMPPAMAVETAEVLASVSGALVESAGFYAANAAGTAVRIAEVIAENAGDSIGAGLGSWLARLLGSGADRAGGLSLLTSWATEFGSGAASVYDELKRGADDFTSIADPIAAIIDELPISVLEDMPSGVLRAIGGLERIEGFGGYEVLGKALAGLDALEGADQAWNDTVGETTVARAFTAYYTGEADFAINYFPVTGVANFLDGGSLQADANISIQIVGGFISGGPKEAMVQWDNAANEVADGQMGSFPKLVSKGVNWLADEVYTPTNAPMTFLDNVTNTVVSATYAPISSVVSHVSDAVSSTEHTVTHLASSGFTDIEHIL